ncbi:MAG: carbamate kinase [Endomicrobia bacterium]|nr:carbamate kinase [Endomicrobiia bacterium]MCX7940173.1 carbamate kinase [Endomicrobiia bacterium]MDW8055694.1 carbamate kinase [Elusimicrobiota bacterium]
MQKGSLIVIAVGGNSLIKDEKHMTVPDQYAAACETMKYIADIIEQGYRVIITHGNGPQVGFILMRSEYSRGILHEVPLDSIDADTQGAIGYNFQMALRNEFTRRGIKKEVASIVTQVVVDRDDPAFKNPSKPIGPFYTEEQAKERQSKDGWIMKEDAGRGWRRVVPSPKPLRIVELEVIKTLVNNDIVTIAVGGGGIPVIETPQGLKGVEAVIDKDLASSLLAKNLNADMFIISTAVEKVYLNFNTPQQKALDKVSIEELIKYRAEGHFKPGSMLPKIDAMIDFVSSTGKRGVITCPEKLPQAVLGESGTIVVKN